MSIKGHKIPLIPASTTYSLTPKGLKQIIAKAIEVKEEDLSIDFIIKEVGGDILDRYPGVDTVTEIKLKVKG